MKAWCLVDKKTKKIDYSWIDCETRKIYRIHKLKKDAEFDIDSCKEVKRCKIKLLN